MWDWTRNEEIAKLILKERFKKVEANKEAPSWCDKLMNIVFITVLLLLLSNILLFNG